MVISNEGTHHIATKLNHLHIPLRLALRQILSPHAKETNKTQQKTQSAFYQIYFFLAEKKIKVGKGVVHRNKAYLFLYSKLSTVYSQHQCEE